MFNHPALLRELNLISDHLRRNGESDWSRRVTVAADGVRKSGWTAAGYALIRDLYRGEPGLHQVSFGREHLRAAGGEEAVAAANERLEWHRRRLEDLMTQPTQVPPAGPPQRSPDLGPS